MNLYDAPAADVRPLLIDERIDLVRFMYQPDAHASFSDDAGWRWLTGASLPHRGVLLRGPAILTEPLLGVRGILA